MEELLEKVADGDHAAFEQLYRKLFGLVFHTVHVVVQDHAQSEEVTQETFLELWSKAARFDGAQGTGTRWVTMIARRRAVDRVRSVQAARDRDTLIARQALIPTEPDPSEYALSRLEARRIHDALADLSPDQRTLLERAFVDGLTYGDIAAVSGVSVNTVKSRVRLASAKLRNRLQR